MLGGVIRSARADAVNAASRGALFVYAGILGAAAAILVAIAIYLALAPQIGPAMAMLCGAGFLLMLAVMFALIAQAMGGQNGAASGSGKSKAERAKAESSAAGGETDYAALLANSLASGLLEKELKDHPLRMVVAALAAGTVMGVMEASQSED